MGLLQLQNTLQQAKDAVRAATTDKAREKALADVESASRALAVFQSKMVKKSKKVSEERYEEEDEDEDEESDEDADDEPKKPASGDDDDDSDDDSDDDADDDEDEDEEDESEDEDEDEDESEDEDEDEDEDEEEDEQAAASAISSARAVLQNAKRAGSKAHVSAARACVRAVKLAAKPRASLKYRELRSACERVTGKKGLRAIVGALDALKATAASTEKLANDVAKIHARNKREKVDAMLASARKERKITKAQIPALRMQGLKDTKWLKSYLGTLPKLARGLEDGPLQGVTQDGSKDGDERRAAHLDAQNMPDDVRKMVETLALGTGKSVDEFIAEMQKTSTKSNGAARRAQ